MRKSAMDQGMKSAHGWHDRERETIERISKGLYMCDGDGTRHEVELRLSTCCL